MAYDLWFSQPAVAKYMFWGVHNNVQQTQEWLDFELNQRGQPNWYRFAIECTKTHQLIGSILLYYEDEVCCWEVAYHFALEYWNHGYATESLNRVMQFASEVLHIKEVVARYATENTASGRVLEKMHFCYEKDIVYICNDHRSVYPGIQCRCNLCELNTN